MVRSRNHSSANSLDRYISESYENIKDFYHLFKLT
jgi:hypothetical protein